MTRTDLPARRAPDLAARPVRRATTALVAAATVLGLAACAEPLPTPEPPAAPVQAAPVLTEAQEAAILEAVGETLEVTTEARSSKGLGERLAGPALAIRKVELAVAKATDDDAALTNLPTSALAATTPVAQDWPRTALVVSEQPELETERLLVLDQSEPRAAWKLWAWVRLFPGVTLPQFAAAATGSAEVAPDAEGYLLTPEEALEAYADVLTSPKKSDHLEQVADDVFRTRVAELSKLQNTALKPADGKQTMTFTVVPGELHAIATVDGGVLVVGELTALEDRVAEEGAKISPVDDVEKHLTRKLDVENSMALTYTTVVAIHVPAAGAGDTVTAVGVEHVATKASIPEKD